jgi:hypothetical protein
VHAWHYFDAEGHGVGASRSFGDRNEAEAWLAEEWTDLVEDGVHAVGLFDLALGSQEYRMDLGPGPEDDTPNDSTAPSDGRLA